MLIGLVVAASVLWHPTIASAAQSQTRGWVEFTPTTSWQPVDAGAKVEHGQVRGWRFAVSSEGVARMPRSLPTFEDLCGIRPLEPSAVWVGVLLDFGRPEDTASGTPPAPRAACAKVTSGATSADVLRAVSTQVRVENEKVCAIDGFPSKGCTETGTDLAPAAAAADKPVLVEGLGRVVPGQPEDTRPTSTSWTPWLLGVGVLVVFGAGAFWLIRKFRRPVRSRVR